MEMTLKVDFWFDGIEECKFEEIKNYLNSLLESGAEATCSEIKVIKVI